VKQKVQIRISSTARIYAVLLRHDFIIHQVCIGKHVFEFVEKSPVRGATLSIQQTSGCKKKCSYAKACYLRTLRVLLHDPWDKYFVIFNGFFNSTVNGRNKNQVCFLYILYQYIGLNCKQAAWLTRFFGNTYQLDMKQRSVSSRNSQIVYFCEYLVRSFNVNQACVTTGDKD